MSLGKTEQTCEKKATNDVVCLINFERRPMCPRCRYELCRAAGMEQRRLTRKQPVKKMKHQPVNETVIGMLMKEEMEVMSESMKATNGNSPNGKNGNEQQILAVSQQPLIKEPDMYDGSAVEEFMRSFIASFTSLQQLEDVC